MNEDLTPLTKMEFIQLIDGRVLVGRSPNSSIPIPNREITFDLLINERITYNSSVTVKDLIFKNCRFKNKVISDGYQGPGIVIFEDCTFEAHSTFKGLSNVSFKGSINFMNSVSINTNKGVESSIENINIYDTLLLGGSGSLKICNINIGIHTPISSKIDIGGSFNSIFLKNVNIDYFTFAENALHEMFLKESKINTITLGTLNGNYSTFQCLSSDINQIIACAGQNIESIMKIDKKSKVDSLVYNLNAFHRLECRDVLINEVEFSGENSPDHSISMSNVQFKNLVFKNMKNNGSISLNSLSFKDNGSLKMQLASMGNTDFILCDFRNGNFEFENSKITEAFMAESDFPKKITMNGNENFRQAQLAFGQISTAYRKQGDTVRSLEYQAREIESHYKSLKWVTNKTFSFTKVSLWLNRWSNDFGRNWIRGILFSFIIGAFFFCLLVISTHEFSFGKGFHWSSRFLVSYLRFMNPLRFFETENLFRLPNNKTYLTPGPLSYPIDFLSRILVAYGYYQTIQAFRRFGRSK